MKTLRYFLTCAAAILLLGLHSASGQSISSVTDETTQGNYGAVGSQVIITGSGFTLGTVNAVEFNGVQAIAGGVTADNQIIATVPSGATSGLITIYMTINGASTKFFSPQIFTVIGAGPYVSGFSPFSGSPGTTVTVSGFQFTTVTNVLFNGVVASGRVTSDTQLTVTVPTGAGTGPITVTSPSGSFVTSSNFYVPSVITSFSPNSGRTGTNVSILGTSLNDATGVYIDGLPASFVVNSPSNITAVVPAGFATGPITITAPGGGFVTSSNFVALPTILGFSPAGGPGGTVVTITGVDFGSGSVTVAFSGANASETVNATPTNITVTVPNSANSGPITLTTSVGVSVSTTPFYLPPNAFALSPPGGPGGTAVTFSGVDFLGVTNVSFAGVPATFTILSNTFMVAQAPPGVLTGPVLLSNPGGSSTLFSSLFFEGPPVITSLSTNAGVPGKAVVVTGTNFTALTFLSFGGVQATTVNVANNNQLTAVVPNGVVSGPVTVTNNAGTFSTSFPFYGPPSISSLSPATGYPGTVITITGQNLLGVSGVMFGNIPAASINYLSNTNLQVVVPAGVTNGFVSLTTPGGNASSPGSFTAGEALLTIKALPDGSAVVGWPVELSSWVLQVSVSLVPPFVWTPSSLTPSVVGDQYTVTVPPSTGVQYFRLKQ